MRNAWARLFAPDPFLVPAAGTRSRWPWAVSGSILVIALYVPIFFALSELPEGLNSSSEVFLPGDFGSYVGIGLFGVCLLIAPIAVVTLFHRQPWLDWPTSLPARALADFLKSAAALGLILGTVTGVDFLFRPERFSAQPLSPGYWLWFLLGGAMLLPQTFGEEALFKGYFMRVWGAAFPFRWPVAFVLTAVFTSIHGVNTDFAADRLGAVAEFMLSGLVSFALYFRTGRLAAPTGVHFANNFYALLLVNREPGGMSKGTLITYADPTLLAGQSLLTTPDGFAAIVGGNLLLAVLLLWRGSPLCLADRATNEPLKQSSMPPSA